MKKLTSIKDLTTKARESVYRSRRNGLGHLIGSQADMLDVVLTDRFTFAEIINQTGLTPVRVKSHIRHLLNREDIELLVDEDSRIVLSCAADTPETAEGYKAPAPRTLKKKAAFTRAELSRKVA